MVNFGQEYCTESSLLLQLTYYECNDGYCSEIYNLTCERRCNSKTFHTRGINSILFSGETLVMVHCNRRSTISVTRLDDDPNQGYGNDMNTLMVACTNYTIEKEDVSFSIR